MKTLKMIPYLMLLVLFASPSICFGQDIEESKNEYIDTNFYKIITKDNEEHYGIISKEDNDFIVLKKINLDEETIPKFAVKEREIIDPVKLFGYKTHPTRYLYSPSAIPLKRGSGYLNMLYFLALQAQYGLTDNLSVGITTTPVFMPTLINVKYSHKIEDNLHVAAGAQVGRLWYTDEQSLGVEFGTATYGNETNNISLNLGWGFYGKSNENLPMATVSWAYKSTEKVQFVGEFWGLFHAQGAPTFLGGPALRIKTGKNLFFDIGVVGFSTEITTTDYQYDPLTGVSTEVTKSELLTRLPLPFVGFSLTL